jgi:ABC-2 type transport system ATP-binding protein
MWEFMREINAAGVTIILTTHYLDEAESLCRNIAIIDEGRIIENDTMKNVIGKLQVETFVLTVKEPVSAAPTLAGYPTRLRNEHEIEVEVMKGQGLNDVFAQISAQSLHVASMRTKTNRLEELFIRLVQDKDKEERRSA